MDSEKLYAQVTALFDGCDDAITALEAERRDGTLSEQAKSRNYECYYALREAQGRISDARRTLRELLRS